MGKLNKRGSCKLHVSLKWNLTFLSSLLRATQRRVWNCNFFEWGLCLRNFPLWKIVGPPWKEGGIRLEADKWTLWTYHWEPKRNRKRKRLWQFFRFWRHPKFCRENVGYRNAQAPSARPHSSRKKIRRHFQFERCCNRKKCSSKRKVIRLV